MSKGMYNRKFFIANGLVICLQLPYNHRTEEEMDQVAFKYLKVHMHEYLMQIEGDDLSEIERFED